MRVNWFIGIAACAVHFPALAQVPPPADEADGQAPAAAIQPDADEFLDEEEEDTAESAIVITGQRDPNAVLGDIEPEVQLNRREIRALGAGSVAELLEYLSPQTRSGRGRGGERPVVLLNGRRISGFREIRDLPPEAIIRVDILPEEVALQYGYRPDQRVVNFVLRPRFRAVTAEGEGGMATAGGRGSYAADLNILGINRSGRSSFDIEFRHSDPLFESDRDIVQSSALPADAGDYRSLLAQSDHLSLGGTINRTLGEVSATVNGTFDAGTTRSFLGLRQGSIADGLERQADTLTGHIGIALNGDSGRWRWSGIGNYDRSGTETRTETSSGTDRADTLSDSGSIELTAAGPLFDLPAGSARTSLRGGFDARGLESDTLRGGVAQARNLSRQRGHIQANVDLPIASRSRGVADALGDLSANFNAEIEQFSDFGTLRTFGAGLNWEPIRQVDLLVSYTDEDGAPTMQQLGDPTLLTPGVRVLDFIRGETVEISRLEGGNPDLVADNRRVFKLGLNARPLSDEDLSITANFTRQRIDNPIASFPTATPEIEAAFPERFTRNSNGQLIQIDGRPVNFASSDRDELRWGVNFSTRLGPQPEPPPGGWRGRRQAGEGQRGGEGPQVGDGPPRERRGGFGEGRGASGEGRGGFGRGPGGGFGGRGFGGGRGGRLQLGLYHNWVLRDQIQIRPGLEPLDLLNGSAVGNRGGRPEHEIEFQANAFRNGMGARLSANWQSATFVRGGPGGIL